MKLILLFLPQNVEFTCRVFRILSIIGMNTSKAWRQNYSWAIYCSRPNTAGCHFQAQKKLSLFLYLCMYLNSLRNVKLHLKLFRNYGYSPWNAWCGLSVFLAQKLFVSIISLKFIFRTFMLIGGRLFLSVNVNENIMNFNSGFTMLFASYFVFNIQYPQPDAGFSNVM